MAGVETKMSDLAQQSTDIDLKMKVLAERESVVAAVKAEVDNVHKISARSKADLKFVTDHRDDVAALSRQVQDLLAKTGETEEKIAIIEARRKTVDEVQSKTNLISNLLQDVRVNLETLGEQKAVIDKGATMRLGSYECALTRGTLAHKAYGKDSVRERHRHRFEVNNAYVGQLQRGGMVVSGINPRRNLVEVIELRGHPWFVATQAHPEFQSKPNQAHPLFAAFIAAALKQHRAPTAARKSRRK